MKIIKAMVLTGQGPDRVFITTELPSSFITYAKEPLTLQFEATAGSGVAYVKQHFGIDAEVVNRGAKLQHKDYRNEH
jgi:hypothetical protein